MGDRICALILFAAPVSRGVPRLVLISAASDAVMLHRPRLKREIPAATGLFAPPPRLKPPRGLFLALLARLLVDRQLLDALGAVLLHVLQDALVREVEGLR